MTEWFFVLLLLTQIKVAPGAYGIASALLERVASDLEESATPNKPKRHLTIVKDPAE